MALVTGRFDPTGELYATLTADSRLRIWETATGNLRLEHTPTSHLADAYTCLAWSHAKVRETTFAAHSTAGHDADQMGISPTLAWG
jgi:WD40 repeat protein